MQRGWVDKRGHFVAQLRLGREHEELVAAMFRANGLDAETSDFEINPLYEPGAGARYTTRDEDVVVKCGRKRFVVEVKSLSRSFTGPDDTPFPFMYVDSVEGWESKEVTPIAVVLVSQVTKGMAVVPVSAKSEWRVHRTYYRGQDIEYDVYACPRQLLRTFDELVDHIKRRGNAE